MDNVQTKKDLFLAILSLDSYHRGYGIQVTVEGRSDTKLGNATIENDSSAFLTQATTQAVGFYAASYDVSDVSAFADSNAVSGNTVISYRGTDYDPDPATGNDIWNGWAVGAGSTGENTLYGFAGGSQADLTLRFYEANYGDSLLISVRRQII